MGAIREAMNAVKVVLGSGTTREVGIYLLFVSLFSVVSFASKPGQHQYYLNAWAKQSWATEGASRAASARLQTPSSVPPTTRSR